MTEQTQRLAVISRVKTLVLKHHFNIGNVDYAEWCREVDQQSATLAAADDRRLRGRHPRSSREAEIQPYEFLCVRCEFD